MSRTDKTAPYNVKAMYYHEWVQEVHDHRTGVCELPEKPTPENLNDYEQLVVIDGEWVNWRTVTAPRPNTQGWRNTCHWSTSRAAWGSGLMRCGCPMCGQQDERRRELRRERLAARRYTRSGWMKEY